jgi:hypothetical protein
MNEMDVFWVLCVLALTFSVVMEPAPESRRHVMRRLTVQVGLMQVTVGMHLTDESKLKFFNS